MAHRRSRGTLFANFDNWSQLYQNLREDDGRCYLKTYYAFNCAAMASINFRGDLSKEKQSYTAHFRSLYFKETFNKIYKCDPECAICFGAG